MNHPEMTPEQEHEFYSKPESQRATGACPAAEAADDRSRARCGSRPRCSNGSERPPTPTTDPSHPGSAAPSTARSKPKRPDPRDRALRIWEGIENDPND